MLSEPYVLIPEGDMAIAWRKQPTEIHLGKWFSVCIVDVSLNTSTIKGIFLFFVIYSIFFIY